jgi:site-specific DNA-methyltransferase (adenine-specific)
MVKKRYLETKSAIDGMSASRQRNEQTVVQADRMRQNVWLYSVGTEPEHETGTHPAIFPEALARDHILSWSNPGDLVYDCFGGSGTVAKAAHKLDRRWILSEISQEYVDLANKRLEPLLMQTNLFK